MNTELMEPLIKLEMMNSCATVSGVYAAWCLSLQETNEHFLVLFSFHLLILSLDHARQDFIYEVFFGK